MKRISAFIAITLILITNLFSQENQETRRIAELHNQTVFLSTVGIRLTDSNGNTDQCYGNNEDYYVTFYDTACYHPNRLTAVIDELDLHSSDTLYIYNGPDSTYPVLFKGNNTNASTVLYDDVYSSNNIV